MKAIINKIIKFSNVDGPGNRMAIFFQGCNLDCQYCHNPETINLCNNCGVCIRTCPSQALTMADKKVIWDKFKCTDCDMCIKNCLINSSPKTKEYSIEELFEEFKSVKNFVKGVTVSGGECTLHYQFITEFFSIIKQNYPEMTCFVDTNGYVDFSQEEYSGFIKITDFFMLDMKSWDRNEHVFLTGKDNQIIIKNLDYLKSINKLFEVRTVIIPAILQNNLTVIEVAKRIKDTNIKYKLIKYRNIGVRANKLIGIPSPADEEMLELKKLAIGVKNIIII